MNGSPDEKSDSKVKNFREASFGELYSTADATDIILMIIGMCGALVNGACLPLFCILCE
jgi:hypothetical protein